MLKIIFIYSGPATTTETLWSVAEVHAHKLLEDLIVVKPDHQGIQLNALQQLLEYQLLNNKLRITEIFT